MLCSWIKDFPCPYLERTPTWSLNTRARFIQNELMNTYCGGEGFWLPPLELALPNSGLYGKAQIEVAELETDGTSKITSVPLDWYVLCQDTANWSGTSEIVALGKGLKRHTIPWGHKAITQMLQGARTLGAEQMNSTMLCLKKTPRDIQSYVAFKKEVKILLPIVSYWMSWELVLCGWATRGVWGVSQIKCVPEINELPCLCQVFH